MASRVPPAAPTEDEDLIQVEEIEKLCQRMSKYDPCFRTSLIQYHLKRFGISSNDERLVKLISLSFETMMRSVLADCAQVNREKSVPSKTLTSELLNQALLNTAVEEENPMATDSQMNTNNTFDANDLFDFT